MAHSQKSQSGGSRAEASVVGSGVSDSPRGSGGKSGGDGPTQDRGAQGKQVAGQVQEQAGQVIEQARQQATQQLSSQKERAVGTLGTLASVLHDAGRQARDQDEATIGQWIDMVADQIESASGSIRDQDFNQLVMNTGQFARKQPALFLAAAFAAGFVAARLLKSSAPAAESWSGSSTGAAMPGDRWDASGASGYGSGFGSSAGGMGSAGLAASGSAGARSEPGFRSPSQPADTLVGSEWSGAPGYDSGREDR
jgi:hypothetical protein